MCIIFQTRLFGSNKFDLNPKNPCHGRLVVQFTHCFANFSAFTALFLTDYSSFQPSNIIISHCALMHAEMYTKTCRFYPFFKLKFCQNASLTVDFSTLELWDRMSSAHVQCTQLARDRQSFYLCRNVTESARTL